MKYYNTWFNLRDGAMRNILAHLYQKYNLAEDRCIYHDTAQFPDWADTPGPINLYIVAHGAAGKPNVTNHDGTISLSPRDLAEKMIKQNFPMQGDVQARVRVRLACCYGSLDQPSRAGVFEKIREAFENDEKFQAFLEKGDIRPSTIANELGKEVNDEVITAIYGEIKSFETHMNLARTELAAEREYKPDGRVPMGSIASLLSDHFPHALVGGYKHAMAFSREKGHLRNAPQISKWAGGKPDPVPPPDHADRRIKRNYFRDGTPYAVQNPGNNNGQAETYCYFPVKFRVSSGVNIGAPRYRKGYWAWYRAQGILG